MGKIEASGVCALCLTIKPLAGSHIVPHGLLRIARGGAPTMMMMSSDDTFSPRKDRANWVETLLCHDCEKLFNLRYESYVIKKLKEPKRFGERRISIRGFDYDRFYLFWLSLLWRASVSKDSFFSSVSIPCDIVELCRKSLREGTLSGSKLDSNLVIGMVRVKLFDDPRQDRECLSNFIQYTYEKSAGYVFIIAGFAIIYQISSRADEPLPNPFSKIKRTLNFRLNRVLVQESLLLSDIFFKIKKKFLSVSQLD